MLLPQFIRGRVPMPTNLLSAIQAAFAACLLPFRAIMESFGLQPADHQVWAFMVGLFMIGIALPVHCGDFRLSRRHSKTTGFVAAIDRSGDGPYSPIISFKDDSGRSWSFSSGLPCTAATECIGASVPVIYDPDNPKLAREEGRTAAKILYALLWYAFSGFTFAVAFGLITVTPE
jgi:hypothetical protein